MSSLFKFSKEELEPLINRALENLCQKRGERIETNKIRLLEAAAQVKKQILSRHWFSNLIFDTFDIEEFDNLLDWLSLKPKNIFDLNGTYHDLQDDYCRNVTQGHEWGANEEKKLIEILKSLGKENYLTAEDYNLILKIQNSQFK